MNAIRHSSSRRSSTRCNLRIDVWTQHSELAPMIFDLLSLQRITHLDAPDVRDDVVVRLPPRPVGEHRVRALDEREFV